MIKRELKTRRRAAFTLLELLTVVAIIATLGAVAMPGIRGAMKQARMNAAAQQARQIVTGLTMFAQDNGGVYPRDENVYGESIEDSNAAFRDILDYIDRDERVFAVGASNWGARVDSRVANASQMLEAGENHFAYVGGLSASARGRWPIVVDGTSGSGFYAEAVTERGGCWGGTHAVVARVDGSTSVVRLRGSGNERYIPHIEDPSKNALNAAAYMGSRVSVLDPAR